MLLASIALASPLGAQRAVLLELRPRVGDTLRVRVDQRVEMSGLTAKGDTTRSVTTTLLLRTRCVVERADVAGATIAATTDSVGIVSTGERADEVARARRALEGRTARFHLAPDGSAELVDDGRPQPAELRALFEHMPATLPARAVAVGETWKRRIDLPGPGGAPGGALTASFRLDSLSAAGDLAYVSMSGSLGRASGARGGGDSTSRVSMSGVMKGGMTIDRGRGWMTDARTTLTVTTVIAPPAGATEPPTRVRLRMTQWLRTQ